MSHYAIYREDLPVSEFEFKGNDLNRHTRHPVQEGAVLYDRDGGSIDVIASGGRDVRARIAQSFADNMLCLKGTVRPVAARKFSLERLRQHGARTQGLRD